MAWYVWNDMAIMRRILYVEQNTDGTVGGSHYCLLDMIRHLDRNRFDPLVVFYREHSLLEEFRRHCPVFIMPSPAGVDIVSRLPGGAGPFRPIVRLMQRAINLIRYAIPSYIKKVRFLRLHHIDLVHLNNAVNRGYDWVLACGAVRVKCITHNRGPFRLSRSDRAFARRFDAVVSIAGFLRDELERQGIERTGRSVVVNDGIDADDITSRVRRPPDAVRRELGIAPHDPLIGIVGNVRAWKGQDVVVRAVDLLRRKHPALRCLVIGGISDTRRDDRAFLRSLESYVAGRGLGEHVLLLGFRDDVPDLVNALDILVHASTAPEPFGRVILEGMVLEKPVIATNIGGPLEIVEDRVSGFLVPPDDESALAAAIDTLLADAALRERIARAGKHRVVNTFHIRNHIDAIHDLYEALLP